MFSDAIKSRRKFFPLSAVNELLAICSSSGLYSREKEIRPWNVGHPLSARAFYKPMRIPTSLNILVVGVDQTLADALSNAAMLNGLVFDTVSTHADAIDRIVSWEGSYNIVVADHIANGRVGDEPTDSLRRLLKTVKSAQPSTETIVITHGNREAGVEYVRAGAFDYIDISVIEDELPIRIQQICEIQQLKATAQKKSDFSRKLIGSSPLGIIALDARGRITEFNKAAEAILLYSAEEVIGEPVFGYYADPDEPQRIGELVTASGGLLSNHDTAVRARNGEVIRIKQTATWIYDESASRIGSVGYFTDQRPALEKERRIEILNRASKVITEASSMEEGLHRLAELMVSLIGGTFCRILLIDETGDTLIPKASYFPTMNGSSTTEIVTGPSSISDWPHLRPVLDQGEPVIRRHSDPELQPSLDSLSRRLGLERTIHSLLMVPLKVTDRLIGLLHVGEVTGGDTFKPETVDLAKAIAAPAAVLIDRIGSQEAAVREAALLHGVDAALSHILDELDPKRGLHELVHQAVRLVGFEAGALFINRAELSQVELGALYGASHELSVGDLTPAEGMLGVIIRSGEMKIIGQQSEFVENDPILNQFKFALIIAVPIKNKKKMGVDAVLVLGSRNTFITPERSALDILKKFVERASVPIDTSRLLTSEQQTFAQLGLLHDISEYINSSSDLDKVLHTVLTGITAQYGLKFNRAAVLLIDETGKRLEGRMAIGQVKVDDARDVWDKDQAPTFADYRKLLEHGDLPRTELGERIHQLRFVVEESGRNAFWDVIRDHGKRYRMIDPKNPLPSAFVDMFRPQAPVILIPLITSDEPIGLLVADNKFTQAPITPRDVEALIALSNTASGAISNLKLSHKTQSAHRKLQALFQASTALVSAEDPDAVLETAVDRAREAAGAFWVSFIEIDDSGRAFNHKAAGVKPFDDIESILRDDGISRKVKETGDPIAIEDIHAEPGLFNPAIAEDMEVGAAVCLPIALQGSVLGVMWVHYREPRSFQPSDINNLQLYVNQAALAWDNARRIAALKRIREAAKALAAKDRQQDVVRQIVLSARSALLCDSAILWFCDGTKFLTEESVAEGLGKDLWEDFRKTGPTPGGTASRVIQLGVLEVEDIQGDATLGPRTKELMSRTGAQRFLGIALKTVKSETLGVLYVNYNAPRPFRGEERETILAFADYAALALKKAKLLEQVNRAHDTAQAVAHVTVIGDLENTLLSITQGTLLALGCHVVSLYVYYAEEDRFGHPPNIVGALHPERAKVLGSVAPESIVFTALHSEEIIRIEDLSADPRFQQSRFTIQEGIKSCAAIPLRVGLEKVGVMFVNYRERHTFSDDEVGNILLYSRQAAIAIHNAKLFSKNEKQIADQSALLKLSQALLGTLDLQATMDLAVAFTAKMVGTEFCNIVLPNDTGDLDFRAAYGWPRAMINNTVLGRGSLSQAGYTIKTGQAVILQDLASEHRFKTHPSAAELGIVSGLSVPMFRGTEIVGAMLIHTKSTRTFTQNEIDLLHLIANETAIAIQSAERYEDTQKARTQIQSAYDAVERANAQIQAVYRACKAITEASLGLERRRILDDIVAQSLKALGPKATLGTLQIYKEDSDELVFESVYPENRYRELVTRVGESRPLAGNEHTGWRKGVIGAVVEQAKKSGASYQILGDVTTDIHYVKLADDSKSEIAVALIEPVLAENRPKGAGASDSKYRVLGVLNIESDQFLAFTEEDLSTLNPLAELAVIAIKNAEQHEELKRIKGLVGSGSVIEWVKLVEIAWHHSIEGWIGRATDQIELLRGFSGGLPPSAFAAVDTLEEAVRAIASNRASPLLTDEAKTFSISDFMEKNLPTGEYEGVLHDHDLTGLLEEERKNGQVFVRASILWLAQALDILGDNARHAIKQKGTSNGLIKYKAEIERGSPDKVVISVIDNGPGIESKIRETLFVKPVDKKPGESGMGIGLMIADAILKSYDSEITLGGTSVDGTEFVIKLPVIVRGKALCKQ